MHEAGSALRTGGGYAQAALHVLETPQEEDESSDDGEGLGGGAMADGARKPSLAGGLLGLLESAAGTRKQSFNKFQT